MTLLGERGLRDLATLNHSLAVSAADRLAQVAGVSVINNAFFNEFTVRLSKPARQVVRNLAGKGVLGGVSLARLYPGNADLENGLVVAVTETTTVEDIEALATALAGELA